MAPNVILDPIVSGVGALMIAGANLVAAIMGRKAGLAPPIREVSLLNRLSHVVAVLAVIGVWYLSTSVLDRSALATAAMGLLATTVLVLVFYILATSLLTVRCPDDERVFLGGLWLTKQAKTYIRLGQQQPSNGPSDIQDYFCNNDRNAGLIWSWTSRAWASAMLALFYAVLIFAATSTLTAGWMLLTTKAEIKAPASEPEKSDGPEVRSVVIPSDLLFDYGKAELTAASSKTLHRIAEQLRSLHVERVEISGHTDDRGSTKFNELLSERRAAAVYEWLIEHGCLGSARITAKGSGARMPVAPNVRSDGSDYPDGRMRNRRVELTFSPVALGEQRQRKPAADCPEVKGELEANVMP